MKIRTNHLSRADLIGMVLEEQVKDRLPLELVAQVEERKSRTHARSLVVTFNLDLHITEKARLIGLVKHEDPGVVFDHY